MSPRARLLGLLAAHTTSAAGNAATAVALPLFVLADTGSAALTGLVGAAAVAPVVVGGIFGGVLVDRFGHRRASIVSDLVGAVTIAAVPALHLTTGLPLWGLLALVVATGLLDTPGQAARRALLPELASAAGLPLERATGWLSAAERTAVLVGAPLAGVLVALLGAPLVLALDAVTFLASAAVVGLAVPGAARAAAGAVVVPDLAPTGGVRGYLRDLREGLDVVRRDRLLVAVVAVVAVTNAIDAASASVVLPVYATERLGSAGALGLLIGAFGGGAVLGSLIFSAVGSRWSRHRVFTVGFLLAGGPWFALLALSPGLPVLLVGAALSGLAAGSLNPVIGAVQLERVPVETRARVAGVVGAGAWGSMPLGILGAGLCLEHGSLTSLLVGMAVGYLLVTLAPAVFPVWRELDRPPLAASVDGR